MISASKTVAGLLALLMALSPVAAGASDFQYFRMNGGGSGIHDGGGAPPQGQLTYAIAGAASATVGDAYAATAQVAGAVGTPAFSVQSGSLDGSGLALDPVSGTISGILVGAGNVDATLKVVDAAGASGFATFHLVVSPVLTAGWIPAEGKVGVAYVPNPPIVAGGTAPISYSLAGSPPPGLVFSQSSGNLAGTPTAEGSYPLSVTVVDGAGGTASTGIKTVTIDPADVAPPTGPALALTGTPGTTAQVGVGYVSHFGGSGGTTPYSFGVATGTLPSGLVLDAASGVIGGTPDTEGSYPGISIRVTDADHAAASSGTFTITVAPQPALLISGNPPSNAQVGQSYVATFAAFDGSGTGYAFTSVGAALPPGLILSTVDGTEAQIAGTPTQAGTYDGLQIQVTDSGGHAAATAPFSIAVAPAPDPLTPGTLQPWADVDAPYSQTLTASGGGGAPYLFAESSGEIPPGLTLASDGTLAGTPSAKGSFSFAVNVTDAVGGIAARVYTVAVSDALAFAPTPPSGVIYSDYSYQPTASGGTPPYSFTPDGGSFPGGVSMSNQGDGLISGIATTVGSQSTTLVAQDAVGRHVAVPVTIAIYAETKILPGDLPDGAVGEAYVSVPPTASGGDGHYVFALSPDPGLAAHGLVFDTANGAVTGTPTASGTLGPFAISFADGQGRGGTAPSSSFSVQPALAAGTPNPPSATAGQAYSYAVPFSGGTGTRTFTLASGSLPAWLTLNQSNGTLSGTPQTADAGTVGPLTVSAGDGNASATSMAFSFTVASAPPTLSGTPPAATQGTAYSFALTALTSGGAAPYSYALSSGSLPDGLSLASNGLISGTPSPSAVTASATVTVTDANGQNASASLTFAVNPAASNAVAWGWNAYGQIGNDSTADIHVPVPVTGGATYTQVSAGEEEACAVVSGGTVQCWGSNAYGQLGNNSTATSFQVPVAVSGLTNATTISVGQYSACAVISGGTVQCWGLNTDGQLGNNSTATRSQVPVAVSGLTGAVGVSVGYYSACALISGGTVKCWGYNYNGQLGNNSTTNSSVPVAVSGLTGATAVAVGQYFACALISGGTVKCWGYNAFGEIGDGTTTQRLVPVAVSGLTNATAVSAGNYSTCAVVSGGTVKCWGYNGYGSLGDGTTTQRLVPVAVSGLTNATAVSAGNSAACAVISGGTVKCWGYNGNGGLGNNSTVNSSVPVAVSGLTGATAVSVGDSAVVAR